MAKKRRDEGGAPAPPAREGPEGGRQAEGKGPPPDEGPRSDTDIERDLEELERRDNGPAAGGRHDVDRALDENLRPDTPDEQEGR